MKINSVISIFLIPIIVIGTILVCFFYPRNIEDQYLTLYGNVEIRQVSLAFENTGRVIEMAAEEGDTVKAGQVLARLDDESYRLKLLQAESQVEVLKQTLLALQNGNRPEEIKRAEQQMKAAQAEMERSKIYWQRLQKLSGDNLNGSVSKQDLDNAHSQYKVAQAQFESSQQSLELLKRGTRAEELAKAQAQLSAAEAEKNLIQYNIQQMELKAPQDGVIAARLLEVGDMAYSQRLAYNLSLHSPKWIRTYVNESELGLIKPNIEALVFTDTYPEKAIQGHVGYISSIAEFTPKTVQTSELRTALVYEVRIKVDDTDDYLRLGMPVTVKIAQERTE